MTRIKPTLHARSSNATAQKAWMPPGAVVGGMRDAEQEHYIREGQDFPRQNEYRAALKRRALSTRGSSYDEASA